MCVLYSSSSSSPLSIVGMLDGFEAGSGEGHTLRRRLRHRAGESLGREVAILLLAIVQSESVRSPRGVGQIRQ